MRATHKATKGDQDGESKEEAKEGNLYTIYGRACEGGNKGGSIQQALVEIFVYQVEFVKDVDEKKIAEIFDGGEKYKKDSWKLPPFISRKRKEEVVLDTGGKGW